MRVSVAYITHRPTPRFGWFADSLAAQLDPRARDDCEVIVVDGLYSEERAEETRGAVDGRFWCRHVPAKPTPFNGPYRRTQVDYHAPASARNTGIVYARHPYVMFVDDCSVVMPGWWEEVQAAARLGYVVAGASNFHREMVVENGLLVGSKPFAVDTRWEIGDDELLVQCRGDQLYGGNFGAPRDLLLEVNGQDELCDSMRGQDYHLGLRLEWGGTPIFFSRRMLLIKSEERHARGHTIVRRLNKPLDPSAYMKKLREFGVTRRTIDGDWDSTHLVLDILHGRRLFRSIGNYYDLRELDETGLEATVERFPQHYWVDGRPLAEM